MYWRSCSRAFGAMYDFYIERPWLMKAIGRTVWGIDADGAAGECAASGSSSHWQTFHRDAGPLVAPETRLKFSTTYALTRPTGCPSR